MKQPIDQIDLINALTAAIEATDQAAHEARHLHTQNEHTSPVLSADYHVSYTCLLRAHKELHAALAWARHRPS